MSDKEKKQVLRSIEKVKDKIEKLKESVDNTNASRKVKINFKRKAK